MIASSGIAQATDPPYGSTWSIRRNKKIEVKISGFGQPGIRISGTNVNFGVSAGEVGFMLDDPVYQGNEPWDHVFLDDLELSFSEVSDKQNWSPGELLLSIAHGVRLSTTHFTNGDQQINLKGQFRLTRDGDPEDIEQFEMSASVGVSIYNRALILGTVEKWGVSPGEPSGTPPHWYIDLAGMPSTMASTCLTKVIAGLGAQSPLKHIIDPATAESAKDLVQADLITKFKQSTVFFTLTHGTGPSTNEPYGIRASKFDTMPWQNASQQGSVAHMCLNSRGDVPLYNLVILICCTGIANGSWNQTSSAFGIDYPSTPNQDRICLAWGGSIAADPPRGNDVALPKWSEKMLEYLAQGYTVQSAEDRVYRTPTRLIPGDNVKIYPTGSGGAMRPVLVGDPLTKLKGAYLSQDQTAPCFLITLAQ